MKKIVIIDDSQAIVLVLKAYIRAADNNAYDIVTFENMEEGAEYITDNYVDLLFNDVHVNGNADGLISAGIAKEKGIPVVIMTADSSLDNIKNLADGNYCRYILKPIINSIFTFL